MAIKTDTGTYLPSPTPNPLPQAGGSFIDGLSGVKLTRLTDERDGPGFGTTYSIWATANVDNTRLWVYGSASNSYYTAQFDPATVTLLRPSADESPLRPVSPAPGRLFVNYESALWSGLDADKLFLFVDAKLYAYRPSTGTYTLIKDLTPALGSDYYFLQQFKSRDDKRFAASGPFGFVVYDVEQDRLLLDVRTTDMNGIALDRSGKWLLYVPDDDNTEYVYNVETGTRETITSNPTTGLPDFTIGHCDVGTGVIAGNDRWRGAISFRQFSTPHNSTTPFVYAPYWISQHLSMTADDENWALLSTYGDVVGPVDPNKYKSECFQVGLQGSAIGKIRRLFHHRARTDDPDFAKRYWAMPKGNVSRDGRFVFFTSNMGGARNDLWVADLLSSGSVPPDTTTPPPDTTPLPEPPLPEPIPEPPLPIPPDPIPPQPSEPTAVTIISPVQGATVKGEVTVTVEVTNEADLDSAYLLVDSVVHSQSTTLPCSFKLDTTKLSDGSHSLWVRVWDRSGKAFDSPSIGVVVANAVTQPPVPEPVPEPLPTPTPVPIPEPVPAPTPAPPPPTPCTMTLSLSPATIPAWGTGKLVVTLSGLTEAVTVKVTSSSGQVTVIPPTTISVATSLTSSIIEFKLQVKRKSGSVTVSGPCGTQTISVPVK